MFNFDYSTIGSLIFQILLLAMLISSLLIKSKVDRNKKLQNIAIWLLIIFVGTIIYNNKSLLNNFVPYVANTSENGKIEIQKSSDNHFYLMTKVNGKNIIFLIDTGATTTTLTEKDAKRIGINLNDLKYNQIIKTANGISFSAVAKIENFEVGNFRINDFWVLVNKNLSENSLLGMNFLKKLKGYEVFNNKMILYY